MNKIIFVDDDIEILHSIRRMLYSMRSSWDVRFAKNGHEVIQMMEKEKFDVIISDMLMPQMSGAELLEFIRLNHPETIRIALSGQSDRKTSINAVNSVHQFLAKPIESENLKSTILFALTLNQLLNSEELKGLVSSLKSVPSNPIIYQKIVQELHKKEPSFEVVGALISNDISLSSKILQLVNSAFFGLPRHVSSPTEATILLGFETIRDLTLYLNVFSQFSTAFLEKYKLHTLNDHSIRTAVICKKLASRLGLKKQDQDLVFIAGLMHDIGKLILVTNFPNKYLQVLNLITQYKLPEQIAEKKIFYADHNQIGAYLLGLWNFSELIVQAVVSHHENPPFVKHSGIYSQILDCANQIEKYIFVYKSDLRVYEYIKQLFEFHQFPIDFIEEMSLIFLKEVD